MATATPDIVPWWTVQRADDAIVATAIHDGSGLRHEVAAAMVLPRQERLREEDPFTGQAILDVPTHVIPHRSRFEVDLNRVALFGGAGWQVTPLLAVTGEIYAVPADAVTGRLVIRQTLGI